MPHDVQQLVRRLGRCHPAHRVVHHGNGDVVPVQLGVLDDIVFGDGAGQVVLEQLLHLPGVGAGAAQEGCRLKGAAAGAHGEVLGIQHDARQQGLRLCAEQVGGLRDVLEQLGDQLAGGGGVGLVVVQRRVPRYRWPPAGGGR